MLSKLPIELPENTILNNNLEDILKDVKWDDFHEWIDEIAEVYGIYDPNEFVDIILEALKESE